jgi:diguanylate cyclase (GGDEF)-like protein
MRQAGTVGPGFVPAAAQTAAVDAAASRAAAFVYGERSQATALAEPLLDGGESAGLRDVAQRIALALGAACSAIYLLHSECDELILVAGWSQEPSADPADCLGSVVRLTEAPPLAEAVRHKRLVHVGASAPASQSAAARWLKTAGAEAALVVPLELMSAVVGCLVLLDGVARRALREEERELLTALGTPVGAALSNARRLRDQKERNRQLDSLLESIRAMTSSATLADVLDVVAAQAAAALGVPSCVIYEYVAETDALVLRADIDHPKEADQKTGLGESYDLADYPFDRRLLEAGEIVQQSLSDELLDERMRETMIEFGERSCLSVPLSFKGQAVGLLEIIETRWERDFTQAERDMARAIGEQAAAAIVNARLYRDQELHAQRLASLLEVGRTISSSMALPELLEQVARVSAEALKARLCVVLEFDAAGDRLVFRAGHDREAKADEAYWEAFTYSLADYPGDRAILTGRQAVVEHVGDPGVHPVTRECMEEWGVQTYLNVPLTYGGELLGLLELIETDGERHFSSEELGFADGIGEQVAVAVHNARRYRELRDATDALENQLQVRHNLLELSEVLLTLRSREQAFEAIAHVLGMLVHYESLEISLIDRATNELVEVFQGEGSVNLTLGLRLPLGDGVCGAVIASGQPEMVNDMLRDPRAVQVPGTDEEEQASIIVPLQVAGEIIGVLSVSRFDGRTFSERELELVKLVTNLTAIAIQNARLYGELQDKAIRDGLTGLYNHRHFYERLGQEVARSRRYGTRLSLLMIDLDDFKRYNDRHGHVVGDEALSRVARCLLAEVRRDVDIVARYGGEEFAILLPNTACGEAAGATPAGRSVADDAAATTEGAPDLGTEGVLDVDAERALDVERQLRTSGCAAAVVAERIRARVAGEILRTEERTRDGHLTVSIGIATLPDVAYDEHQLVEYADKALYLAKRLGKNRVEVYVA